MKLKLTILTLWQLEIVDDGILKMLFHFLWPHLLLSTCSLWGNSCNFYARLIELIDHNAFTTANVNMNIFLISGPSNIYLPPLIVHKSPSCFPDLWPHLFMPTMIDSLCWVNLQMILIQTNSSSLETNDPI